MRSLQPIRRVPAARAFARALRRSWEQLRPLPHPRYRRGTPDTGSSSPYGIFFPPTISTLAEGALAPEAVEFVIGLLHKLTASEETWGQEFFQRWAQGRFGRHWRYADVTTVLTAASMLIRPKSYLEIGVRRGRSAAVVGATAPDCAIYGFDLWLEDYAGLENPGPDFVRSELRAAGHTGQVTLISGNSHRTVPAFLRERPDLFFDLITVDGDHSVPGAARDLADVLPRLKVGGVIVFDDIAVAPQLVRVWRRLVADDRRYRAWEFDEAGAGIAAAVRVGV